jgi:hypothetical protein
MNTVNQRRIPACPRFYPDASGCGGLRQGPEIQPQIAKDSSSDIPSSGDFSFTMLPAPEQ